MLDLVELSPILNERFISGQKERTLFIKKDSNGCILVIKLYINDLINTVNSRIMLHEFNMSMMNELEMSDLEMSSCN